MERVAAAVGVGLIILIGVVVYLAMAIEEPETDPVKQREWAMQSLERYAAVFAAYRAAHDDAWPPNLHRLHRFSRGLTEDLHLRLTSTAIPGAGIYRYRVPEPGADPASILMASPKALPALPPGSVLAGRQLEQGAPALHCVLRVDGQLAWLDADALALQAPFAQASVLTDAADSDQAAAPDATPSPEAVREHEKGVP